MKSSQSINKLANFLFEISTLKRLQRTGWQILGDGRESIAEHSFMVAMIGYTLATKLNADIEKVLIMSLFHDIEEIRTGDVYRLADSYVHVDTSKALTDTLENAPDKETLEAALKEYEKKESMESKIVKDADTLALCIELKQLIENGNTNASEWLASNIQQLFLEESKKLGKEIVETNSQNWWKRERARIHTKHKRP